MSVVLTIRCFMLALVASDSLHCFHQASIWSLQWTSLGYLGKNYEDVVMFVMDGERRIWQAQLVVCSSLENFAPGSCIHLIANYLVLFLAASVLLHIQLLACHTITKDPFPSSPSQIQLVHCDSCLCLPSNWLWQCDDSCAHAGCMGYPIHAHAFCHHGHFYHCSTFAAIVAIVLSFQLLHFISKLV